MIGVCMQCLLRHVACFPIIYCSYNVLCLFCVLEEKMKKNVYFQAEKKSIQILNSVSKIQSAYDLLQYEVQGMMLQTTAQAFSSAPCATQAELQTWCSEQPVSKKTLVRVSQETE